MNAKSLILASAVALFGLTVASAKSYDIVLSNPAVAGSQQLKAGDYSLKLKGTTAVFTDQNTDKSYSVPVKIENGSKKHDVTSVDTQNKNGTDRIQSIQLGGSSTVLEFTE